jgi:hypothetical protein
MTTLQSYSAISRHLGVERAMVGLSRI